MSPYLAFIRCMQIDQGDTRTHAVVVVSGKAAKLMTFEVTGAVGVLGVHL